jgi:hypothetical protein
MKETVVINCCHKYGIGNKGLDFRKIIPPVPELEKIYNDE